MEQDLHRSPQIVICVQTVTPSWPVHQGKYTHPLNGPLSRTTRVSRYQKGKTNLDFTEARDSEWQWHQLGHMQVCTSLQTDNHDSTPPLSFYRPDALPAAQPTASKHWRYTPRKVTDKLQQVLNNAARVIAGTRKFDRSLGQILHANCIGSTFPTGFKLAVTVHQCLNGRALEHSNSRFESIRYANRFV